MEAEIFFHIPYQLDFKFWTGRTACRYESLQVHLGFPVKAANMNGI